MRFSYRGLESYFKEPLPKVEVVIDKLINHAFEVENVSEKDNDWEFEVKILPNRATDVKTPLGLARELSGVLDQPLQDNYWPITDPQTARATITFTSQDIINLIGVELSQDEIIGYLKRVRVTVVAGKKLEALIPPERLDLNLKEDLADEVARLYGYDRIPTKVLPVSDGIINHYPDFILTGQLRKFFLERNFTEIYDYSFTDRGEIEVEKPLTTDKAFLRADLVTGLKKSLKSNLNQLLFDDQSVKLFEIGSVFPSPKQEEKRLAIGMADNNSREFDQNEKEIKKVIVALSLEFKVKEEDFINRREENLSLVEIPLRKLTGHNQEPDLSSFIKQEKIYQPFSIYPRIIRDLALWVPADVTSAAVSQVIENKMGELVVLGPVLFDEFQKGDKKSFAFRLVFQAPDRTLDDRTVNEIMLKISHQLTTHSDWQIR